MTRDPSESFSGPGGSSSSQRVHACVLHATGGRASGGLCCKRQRRRQQAASTSQEMMAAAQPTLSLHLLAVVKRFHDTRALLQLCDAPGHCSLSLVQLTPRVPCLFAAATVYELVLTRAQRLSVTGCGATAKVVQLLSEGRVGVLEPACQARTPGAALKLMHIIARRVTAGLAASTPEAIFGQGIQLYAAGQYQTAAARFEAAAALGHACARAELAWLLLMGREGVAVDEVRALQLTEEGWCLGCMQSAGVLAWCCMMGCGSPRRHARALQLGRASAAAGSRYGQVAVGAMHWYGWGGLPLDYAQALDLYRLAAAQGLDEAQCRLGDMLCAGIWVGLARDLAQAFQYYIQAAQQGHAEACFRVAVCHERGWSVAADVALAVSWHGRAAAAGHVGAARALQRLGC